MPGAITAGEITLIEPTPEPASIIPIGAGLSAFYLMRRRRGKWL